MESPPNSEAYFRSLIEDALDIITVSNRRGIIQYSSPSVQKILGYHPDELLGTQIFHRVHPDDRLKAMTSFVRGLLHPGQPQATHVRFQHKDGSWRTFESIGKYVKDTAGGPRVIINSRDITERQDSIRRLQEMEEMYRQILDAFTDLVLVKGPKSQILWANKAFRDYYGMTNEALRGIIDAPFNEPDYTQQYVKDDALVFETGRTLDVPSEPVTRADGQVRLFHTVKAPIFNTQTHVVMTVGVSRDITDRGNLEAIVHQTEKMSAVGQLASGVAHEINNPLTVILGFAQAMLPRLETSNPMFAAIKSIERETLRCKNLVQDLLTFSRERKPGMAPENAESVVEGALSLVEPQARVKNVQVHRDYGQNLPPIQADRNQIQQVIINLCTNAMDAMPAAGDLTVKIRKQGKKVEIQVTDTGSGIPKDIQKKIFEPFFTTKEVGKGTGLGLSLAYEIVSKHQGHIHFTSNPGQGTTFSVLLPTAARPALHR